MNRLWLPLLLITLGCGGSPQASLQQPVTPPPTVAPVPVPPPPPPSVPTSWTVTDLVPLAGFNASQANAVNSSGVVVGYSETPAGVTEATMWANGQVIDLGPGIATAVNDSGQVTGYTQNVDFTFTAHLWQGTMTTDLGDWLPLAINNSGLIVGEDDAGTAAMQWTAAAGLRPIPGCKAALGVNDSGQISGIASNGNATVCGMADYGAPGAAVAINSSGQAVGYLNSTPDTANAALFPNTVLAQSGLATGINELGWVIGETITSGGANGRHVASREKTAVDWAIDGRDIRLPGRDHNGHSRMDAIAALAGQSHPFIWSQASGPVALPDALITAEGINGSRIVGAGLADDGTIHGFLLEGR